MNSCFVALENQLYSNVLSGRKLFLSKMPALLFVEQVSLDESKATLKVRNNFKMQHSAKAKNQWLLQRCNTVI